MSVYSIAVVVLNFFSGFVMYKFMHIFFGCLKVRRRFEVAAYILFALISSLQYLFLNTPILNMFVNLGMLFFLTFLYDAKMNVRLIALVFTISTCAVVEILVGIVVSPVQVTGMYDHLQFADISVLAMSAIIQYAAALIIGTLKHIRTGMRIPTNFWVAVVILPAGSALTIILMTPLFEQYSVIVFVITGIALVTNFSALILYDRLNTVFQKQIDRIELEKLNQLQAAQMDMLQQALLKDRSFRHDLKNHLISLKFMIQKEGRTYENTYFEELIEKTIESDCVVFSGNIEIDGLLSFKQQVANSKGIAITVDAQIPSDLSANMFDIITIIGNLIDNAIEAACRIEQNRTIKLSMHFSAGLLTISTENPFVGILRKNAKNKYLSTKNNSENHGFGLQNVEAAVNRHKGIISISCSNSIFFVEISMYV